jgi:hypothetical protein
LNCDQQNRTLNRKKLETEEHYIGVIPSILTLLLLIIEMGSMEKNMKHEKP